jgi:hypothetical protein
MKMTQKIRDAIGNIADVIRRIGTDGKEHVIIKKSYKNIPPKPEVKEGIDPEIASKCITDWRDLFNETRKQES